MSGMRGSRMQHHSWFKVKLHNYICRKCGARKVNVDDRGGWSSEWHLSDGSIVRRTLAPPCVVGPETSARLVWLSEHLAGLANGDQV